MDVIGHRPACRITVDGQPVSSEFDNRLETVEVVDNAGGESDSCDFALNDWPCMAIPRKGAEISISLGYSDGGLVDKGKFLAEEVEVEMLPFRMRITGRAADMAKKAAKQHKERHWDNKPIKDIVGDLAKEIGLTARVGSQVGAFVYKYFAQQNESPVHVLQRLAERHDALFSIKSGNLVFSERASGASASGQALAPVVITPAILLPGTAKVRFSDRTQSKTIKGSYTDPGKAEKTDVDEESDSAGEAIERLPEQYADEAEAKAAAKSRGKQLKRREATFDCEIYGDPNVIAGAPLTFAVGRPGVDGLPFMIDTARHTYDKSNGYTTKLSGESKDGQGDAA